MAYVKISTVPRNGKYEFFKKVLKAFCKQIYFFNLNTKEGEELGATY